MDWASLADSSDSLDKDKGLVIDNPETQDKDKTTLESVDKDSNKKDVVLNNDLDLVPVEGGTGDLATDNGASTEERQTAQRKRHHHHRKNGSKRRGNKKNGKGKDQEKPAEPTMEEDDGFNLEKFYKEHPDFEENIATISDNDGQAKSKDKYVKDSDSDSDSDSDDTGDGDDDSEDEDDDDSEDDSEDDSDDDSEGEEEDVDDVDKASEEDDDDLIDSESEDENDDSDDDEESDDDDDDDDSSEMDFFDYFDTSRYSSSSEQDDDYFDSNDWYNKMFGDQPVKTTDDKKIEPVQEKDVSKTEEKPITTSVEYDKPAVTAPVKEDKPASSKVESKKSENIPKTDIEPSTSPNPPTPKKDVKSTVTQPVYPEQKSMLQTWNYIESTPIEACQQNSNCSAGRMCMFGLCLCGQPDFCDGHNKPVCGSDGRRYPSHCELHRTACVLKIHIRVDFTGACMPKPEKNAEFMVPAGGRNLVQTTKAALPEAKPEVDNVLDTELPVKQATDVLTDMSNSEDSNEDITNNQASEEKDQIKLDNINTDKLTEQTAADSIGLGVGTKLLTDSDKSSSEDLDLSDESEDTLEDDDDISDELENKIDSVESVSEDVSEELAANPDTGEAADISVESDDDRSSEADDLVEETGASLIPVFCTPQVYQQFKANVLQFHCVLFDLANCDRQTQEEKLQLAERMFNYFDKDADGVIVGEELWEMHVRENMDNISTLCSLVDIVSFDELGERDYRLEVDEFLQAFDIPDLLEHRLEVVPLLATIGNGLETKCDVTYSEDVVWKRNGMNLAIIDFPGISVLGDGSLYLETVGFHHAGNLTCYDRKKPSIKQVHMLTVQKPPHVIVSPKGYESDDIMADIVLHCHAEAYPRASMEWQLEGKALSQGAKYYIHPHDNTLTIMKVDYQTDTGTYKCVAKNEAGSAEASVTVILHGPNETVHDEIIAPEETFIIFHDDGYTMHEPKQCAIQRHVLPDFGNFFFIPDELDAPPALCEAGLPCLWGSAVSVKNKFVYAAQPRENRVIVIDVQGTYNPNQVIFTDKTPVNLYYVEHLDEVWVLCWNTDADTGSKTVVVIRNASQKSQHHSLHTQPIGNRFDVVNEIFLPPSSELHHPYKYGYTVHNGQQGMFKVDLAQKKYKKAVDLTKYNCVPVAIAFVPLGGHILVQCEHKPSQGLAPAVLVLDYVTDKVIGNLSVAGTPYVTPDVNKVIVVNEATGRISVFKVTEKGEIIKQFDVTVGPVNKGVTFTKASYSQGYDVYMSSTEMPSVKAISLENGKVDEIEDVGEPDSSMYLAFYKKTRAFVSGDVFSDFLVTSATSSMVILNDREHKIQCAYKDYQNPAVVSYAHLNNN